MVTLCRATWRARPATKPVRPAARAVGQAEDVDRRLHRARRDVDDAPEAALDHRIDRRLDELDRRQHVGVERADPGVAVPVAEIAGRRPAGVVDQDVGLRARGERRGAALRRGDVAGDPLHALPARRLDRLRGRAQRLPGAGDDGHRAAGGGQRLRAAAPQSLARRADQRAPSRDAEIHVAPFRRARRSTRRARMTTVPIASDEQRRDQQEDAPRRAAVEHGSRSPPGPRSRRGRVPSRRSRRRAPTRPAASRGGRSGRATGRCSRARSRSSASSGSSTPIGGAGRRDGSDDRGGEAETCRCHEVVPREPRGEEAARDDARGAAQQVRRHRRGRDRERHVECRVERASAGTSAAPPSRSVSTAKKAKHSRIDGWRKSARLPAQRVMRARLGLARGRATPRCGRRAPARRARPSPIADRAPRQPSAAPSAKLTTGASA